MRRPRKLSGEERRLWAEIARTARPLPGKAIPPAPPVPEPQTLVPVSPPDVSFARSSAAPMALQAAAPRPGGSARLALHPIERPVRRKLGRGRLEIEDRIDLHGRTEAAAHTILLGFLRHAQGAGFRHVLVITGRGASFGSRGVLKQALPHWFATTEFRVFVAGYEPAERSHGGDGAFYVRIRRR